MNRINIPYILLIVLLAVSVLSFKAAHIEKVQSERDDIRQQLLSSKVRTLDILNAMPAEDYIFQPNEVVMTFEDQAKGIFADINTAMSMIQSGWQPVKQSHVASSKAYLIENIDRGFESLINEIDKKEFNSPLVSVAEQFITQNTNKRGQMLLYLQMKGIQL